MGAITGTRVEDDLDVWVPWPRERGDEVSERQRRKRRNPIAALQSALLRALPPREAPGPQQRQQSRVAGAVREGEEERWWRRRRRQQQQSKRSGRSGVGSAAGVASVSAAAAAGTSSSSSPSAGRGGTPARHQHHAVAGAVAGMLVSCALHPVDTLKTFLQRQPELRRKPLHAVAAHLVRVRGGPAGFYSGLGANLASSAPISAVYATTYEASKSALLRRGVVPAEHRWAADVLAGAMASVATSFIYTPCECLKQRVQLGEFSNAPSAFAGVVRARGVGGLYRGWGAVLCRNVPQSALKFFAFERLRNAAVACNGGGDPTALQTAAIGGVAGSAAALFTTPFDVVKTRMLTRSLVGSEGAAAGGVWQTATGIVRSEGMRGLYAGVGPRLLIYISQGAIFFASYELTKRLLGRSDEARAWVELEVEKVAERARKREAEAMIAMSVGASVGERAHNALTLVA